MLKLDHSNKTRYIDFYMGLSEKFVSPNIDAFPNQKNGGKFFIWKKDKGGAGGVVLMTHFSRLCFPERFPKLN